MPGSHQVPGPLRARFREVFATGQRWSEHASSKGPLHARFREVFTIGQRWSEHASSRGPLHARFQEVFTTGQRWSEHALSRGPLHARFQVGLGLPPLWRRLQNRGTSPDRAGASAPRVEGRSAQDSGRSLGAPRRCFFPPRDMTTNRSEPKK